MSLGDVVRGVGEVAAVAFGANEYSYGIPRQKPSQLPAVMVAWSTSTPTRTNYSSRTDDSKLRAHGQQRKHIGTGYVLLSSSADPLLEAAQIIDAAQLLMDAFDGDLTLRGISDSDRAAKSDVSNVDQFRGEWDGVVYAGLQFEWSALELWTN